MYWAEMCLHPSAALQTKLFRDIFFSFPHSHRLSWFWDGLLTCLQAYNNKWFPHQEFLEPKWKVKNQIEGSIESQLRVIFSPCCGLKCHHLFLSLILCICSLQSRIYRFSIMQVGEPLLWLEYWMYLIFSWISDTCICKIFGNKFLLCLIQETVFLSPDGREVIWLLIED